MKKCAGYCNLSVSEVLNLARKAELAMKDELNYSYKALGDMKEHFPSSEANRCLDFIDQVREMVDNDPSKQIRVTIMEFNISNPVIRLCMVKNI